MNSMIAFLIEEIKKKPQLHHIPDSFVRKYIDSYFLTRGDMRKSLESQPLYSNNRVVKSIVKEVRKEIGEVYGSYQTAHHKKKNKYLQQNSVDELLKCHKSTRERFDYYQQIYTTIISWYNPLGIADIACGFNPISYPILEHISKNKHYYFVCDLNPEDMDTIEQFFINNYLNGVAYAQDVTQKEFLQNLEFQHCDLVLLLKALDSFEKDKKNSSKQLLQELPQKKIVVSFSTQSLVAKKDVSVKKRNWFVRFIEEQEWSYELFEIENELFFLITKN